jgi:hypothetical protein
VRSPQPIDFTTLERGDALPPFDISLDSDEVAAYLDATGEDPERWRDSVPPLALGAFTLAGLMERVVVPDGVVHTGQEFTFDATVAHGETVEAALTVAARSERRGAVMTVVASELRARGQIVGSGRMTVLVPPPEGDGENEEDEA